MRKYVFALFLISSSGLAQTLQTAGKVTAGDISRVQIEQAATALLKLPWIERQRQFTALEADHDTSRQAPAYSKRERLILALLETERRFMRKGKGIEPYEDYVEYVSGVIVEAGSLKNPEAIDALMDPALLDWGRTYYFLGEIGSPVVDPVISEFRRSTNILHRVTLMFTLTAVMEENPDLPQEKRQEIRTFAIAQSASSELGLQLVAIKCLAAFHDSDVTARLTDLKDHSPVEPVRIAAGFALRGIAFPGESR